MNQEQAEPMEVDVNADIDINHHPQLNVSFDTNGLRFFTRHFHPDTHAALTFHPEKKCFYIGAADNQDDPASVIDLHIQGKIMAFGGIDIINEMRGLYHIINEQEKRILELQAKLEQVYFAPGMPGYLTAQTSFNQLITPTHPNSQLSSFQQL